jgi:FixJ family two-component response regulator
MTSPPTQQTVFVVDDDRAIRKSLQLLIEMQGVEVRTFPTAANFLEAYKKSDAGCLILDARMPGMNGLDLQQELAKRSFELPINVLTGYADIPAAIRALKSGAIEFLEKPVEDAVLLDHVRSALALDAERRRRRTKHALIRQRIERLSARELEVLRLVVDGLSSKQIGHQLHIATKTVEAHRLRIMKTMEAESLAELVRDVVSVESKDLGQRSIQERLPPNDAGQIAQQVKTLVRHGWSQPALRRRWHGSRSRHVRGKMSPPPKRFTTPQSPRVAR